MSLFKLTQFDTRQVPEPADPSQRARLWAERFRLLIEEMSVDFAEGDTRVYGRHRFVDNGLVTIGEMDSSSFLGLRGRKHIRPDSDGHVYVGFNIGATRTLLRQFGRELQVDPGESALAVMEASSAALAPSGGTTLNLRIPAAAFVEWGLAPEDFACRRLDHTSAESRLLVGYARLLVQEGAALNAAQAAHASRHLLDLVGGWLGAGHRVREQADAIATAEARRVAIRHVVARHSAEPDFDLSRLSLRLGMPPRTIQHLLGEVDESFSEILGGARLRKARLMLMDPEHDGMAVSDIAFACGFLNVTSFYRAFRRFHGMTPSEMRSDRLRWR